MKHLFIPYCLAVLAKKKGFDERCLGIWLDEDNLFQADCRKAHNDILAPLYQQIVDWLREECDLNIEITIWFANHYKFEIYKISDWNRINLYPVVWTENNNYHKEKGTSSIFSYYEALNKAIEEAFNLI